MEQLGIGHRVILAGLQEQVRPYLDAMDVYLMTSEHEGLPLALLEAMSRKLPVVATAVGGIPEVVQDGLTGYLVTSGDVAGLARSTSLLLADSGRKSSMGRAGRLRVEEKFNIKRMVAEIEATYLSILDRHHGV